MSFVIIGTGKGVKGNYINVCGVKPYVILKIKNVLVKSVYCIMQCTVCMLAEVLLF
jgi:hypothetical protein